LEHGSEKIGRHKYAANMQTRMRDMPLYDVAMISADEGWAVGTRGRLLHYTHGRWVEVISPLSSIVREQERRGLYPVSLRSISMSGAETGWSAGSEGILLTYQNGQWTTFPSPTKEHLEDIHMLSVHAGWAVGGSSYRGCILHYSEGHWTIVDSGIHPLPALTSVSMVVPDEGWIVGAHVWPTNEQDNLGGVESSIFHYQGGRWREYPNPVRGERINAIHMLSNTNGWGVTGHGSILHYTDGGWKIEERFTEAVWVALHMVSDNEGWAVDARQGHILHYNNGICNLNHSPTNESLYGISMVSSDEGWAVGGSEGNKYGTILHYQGGDWEIYSLPGQRGEAKQSWRWWRR